MRNALWSEVSRFSLSFKSAISSEVCIGFGVTSTNAHHVCRVEVVQTALSSHNTNQSLSYIQYSCETPLSVSRVGFVRSEQVQLVAPELLSSTVNKSIIDAHWPGQSVRRGGGRSQRYSIIKCFFNKCLPFLLFSSLQQC